MKQVTIDRKLRRKKRVSTRIKGVQESPRVSVFASNKYTYVQLIDDINRKTLLSLSSLSLAKRKDHSKGAKTQEAKLVGVELAKKAITKGIKKAIFDRGQYSYNGRVKAIAEGLREGGLTI
ncbi:50S ribosomal protein L18 [Candidatus Roizmanbacteria bacterium RIFCSPHIGHO2_01_FULL_39_8]|uniref:Large ribosomal subunit protein uL18 n=2 Tax=Candidatus Roizmaniibacteriota TaxID=1752723 RepID=A0A1F7GNP6_9BACT|nr:MAG: 50S ribosomal protein L18 [Candidatus Roizmanbacteria bacterium RIFCSPHIGHO2_01_FULL_39_8]